MTTTPPDDTWPPSPEQLAARVATERVLDDIRAERATHPARGYDTAHDDQHSAHDLVRLAERYAHRGQPPYTYDRDSLVAASSLLVAAIERHDREEARRGQ